MAAPNTICMRCEPEFLQPNIDPKIGKYRCPKCACRFDHGGANLWPPNARWYWTQTFKPQCPHCDVFLRDRKIVHRTQAEIGAIALLIFASMFSPWRLGTQVILLIVLGAIDFIRWRRAKNCVSIEEERYAIDQSS